jgi:hypothetical protein
MKVTTLASDTEIGTEHRSSKRDPILLLIAKLRVASAVSVERRESIVIALKLPFQLGPETRRITFMPIPKIHREHTVMALKTIFGIP